jgi:uncharacterized protein YhaN
MSQTVDFRAPTLTLGNSATFFQPIEQTVNELQSWRIDDCRRLEDESPESPSHLLSGLSLVMTVLRTSLADMMIETQTLNREQQDLLDELHALGAHHAPQKEIEATALKLAQLKAINKLSIQANHDMIADASELFDELAGRYNGIFARSSSDTLGAC